LDDEPFGVQAEDAAKGRSAAPAPVTPSSSTPSTPRRRNFSTRRRLSVPEQKRSVPALRAKRRQLRVIVGNNN